MNNVQYLKLEEADMREAIAEAVHEFMTDTIEYIFNLSEEMMCSKVYISSGTMLMLRHRMETKYRALPKREKNKCDTQAINLIRVFERVLERRPTHVDK